MSEFSRERIPSVKEIARLISNMHNPESRNKMSNLELQCAVAYEWGAGISTLITQPLFLDIIQTLLNCGDNLTIQEYSIYEFWLFGMNIKTNSVTLVKSSAAGSIQMQTFLSIFLEIIIYHHDRR